MCNPIDKNQSFLNNIPLILSIVVSCVLGGTSFCLAQQYQPTQQKKQADVEIKLLLSAGEVIALKRQNPRFIFVDVRNETEFKKIRIPESINILLPFVKTKAYLLGMKVVLIDNGYDPKRLLLEANSLAEKGFDISVLSGGLVSWRQNGGTFAGDIFAIPDLHVMPAHFLLPGIRSPFIHTYIDISPKQKTTPKINFPNLIHIPIHSTKDVPQLISYIEKQKIEPLSALLIFNSDGQYETVTSLPEMCNTATFFLKGGARGYLQVSQQHKAMIQSRDKRLKTIGGCPTCPASKEKKKQ